MDPKNPRWESSDARVARSALFWKVVVSAAAAAALTTAIVVSCLDRVEERRASTIPPEPAYVETVATAHAPGASTPAPATAGTSTSDSTGGIAEAPPASRVPAPASTTRVTSTTIVETKTPADASAADR